MCSRKHDFFQNLRKISLAALETLEDIVSDQEQAVVRELSLSRTVVPPAWEVQRSENDEVAGGGE